MEQNSFFCFGTERYTKPTVVGATALISPMKHHIKDRKKAKSTLTRELVIVGKIGSVNRTPPLFAIS